MTSTNTQDFKSLFNADSIARLGAWMTTWDVSFDTVMFRGQALEGLETLEMKARAAHIKDALRASSTLKPTALLQAMGRALEHESNQTPTPSGFELWPVTMLVAQEGQEDLDHALNALKLLTRRFTAEFAIQSFLKSHPQQTLAVLREWATSNNEHDRRLVSEGTRVRLPWGIKMNAFFEANQSAVFELLETLKDDPSVYVQKSVANHLNDLTKDHQDLVLQWLERWAIDPTPQRHWIIRHALRTLLKQGSPRALALMGYTQDLNELSCDVTVSQDVVQFGQSITWTARFALNKGTSDDKDLMVDYELCMASAKGKTRRKVFKWRTLTLSPSEVVNLQGAFAFKSLSTRRYYNGTHSLTVLINGVAQTTHSFELQGVS